MTTGGRAALTTDEFDPFVAGLDYPMFVVTTATDGGATRAGCMVGFTTQASIDPPRFLVCLSVKNRTYRVAKDATTLAVHVLDSDDHPLAELFGGTTGDEVDKFARCRWTPGPDGVPLLDGCPRRLVGRVLATHDLGDHVGFLLEPFEVHADPPESTHEEELTFQRVKDVDAGHPA
ncbi:MAG TPA: flavin reductase family protein [Actinomycetales bacterium]|nr:flavin reductase family protein [Actinomycetales bacterium]